MFLGKAFATQPVRRQQYRVAVLYYPADEGPQLVAILYDQDGLFRLTASCGGGRSGVGGGPCRPGGRRRGHGLLVGADGLRQAVERTGQPQAEGGTLAHLAPDGDRTAIRLDQFAAQRQPDTGTCCFGAVDPVEAVEDGFELVGGNTRPGVGDFQPEVVGLEIHGHPYASGGWRVLDRVGEQVDDDRLQLFRIVEGGGVPVGEADVKAEVGALGETGEGKHAGTDEIHQPPASYFEHQAPALESRQFQQLLDQPLQAVDVGADHPVIVAVEEDAPARLAGHIQGAGDERQRRSELMADVGEETRLDLVEPPHPLHLTPRALGGKLRFPGGTGPLTPAVGDSQRIDHHLEQDGGTEGIERHPQEAQRPERPDDDAGTTQDSAGAKDSAQGVLLQDQRNTQPQPYHRKAGDDLVVPAEPRNENLRFPE